MPGLESNFLETELAIADTEAATVKEIKIDPSKTICSVSVKLWNGYAINGLRMTDETGQNLVDLDFGANGNWMTEDIPNGYEIVGMKTNVLGCKDAIPRIEFVLWKPRITFETQDIQRLSWN